MLPLPPRQLSALTAWALLQACATQAGAVQPAPPRPAVAGTGEPAAHCALAACGPLHALLTYADQVRVLPPTELAEEISALGEPGETPMLQMRLAIALAQTRAAADLLRAQLLLQRVLANPANEAQALHPLARLLAARYAEQRRVEDERDRLAQQSKDAQRRIDQLNERLEALRAIERSFSRPPRTPSAAGATRP